MSAPLQALLSELLLRIETDGPATVEAFCATHPEEASELRARIAQLARLGMLPAFGVTPARPSVTAIGRHRIVRVLGKGGMGVVYLAEDTTLGRQVALKTLPEHALASAAARERFAREARAIARLHHAHVVPIYEIGEHDGVPYFTMEHVEGRTLADVLSQLRQSQVHPAALTTRDLQRAVGADPSPPATATGTPPPWGASYAESVTRIALALADALAYVHQEGVLHRDVKPSNVMLGRDGAVRLFDFGLAHGADEARLTLSGDFLGTPHYVSPEQAQGRAIDARTDVYGLGVTLFELLTLQPPFRGASPQEVLRAVITTDAPAPTTLNAAIPRDLAGICAVAIDKEPGRRYASARALADDLRRSLAGEAVHARPIGKATRAWRLVRRNPAPAAALALGAVLVIGTPTGLLLANLRIGENQAKAATLAKVLEEVFLEADYEELGSSASAKDLLLAASRRVSSQLAALPAERSRLLMKLGSVLYGLQEWKQSQALLEDALAEQQRRLGPADPVLAETINHLANVRQLAGDLEDADRLYERARGVLAAGGRRESELWRIATKNLANLRLRVGRTKDAAALLDEVLAIVLALPEPPRDEIRALHTSLSRAHRQLGDRDAAERHAERSLDEAPGASQPRSLTRLHAVGNAGDLALARDDLPRARTLREEALALSIELFGARSTNVGWARYELAIAHFRLGELATAQACCERALADYREILGASAVHPDLGPILLCLGELALAAKDAALAERHLRAALPCFVGAKHFERLHARARLQLCELKLTSAATRAEASEHLEQAERVLRAIGPMSPEDRDLAACVRLRARLAAR